MALSQSLSTIVNVSVVISPVGSPGPAFNQALIVGSSVVIPSSERVRQYTSLAGMASDGFSLTSPEYLTAQLYFGQTPAPTYVDIGCQIPTAIAAATVAVGGTGYAVGDIVTVVQGGGSLATLKITTAASGIVSAFSILTQGTGYSINAAPLATTGGTGTGLTVNITSIGETPLQAVTACRNAFPAWYIVLFVGNASASAANTTGTASSASTALTVASGTGIAVGQVVLGAGIAPGTTIVSGSGTSWVLSIATTGVLSTTPLVFYAAAGNSDVAAIAAYIQGATPFSRYFVTNADAAVLNGTPGNLFATLKAAAYSRTLGMYSTQTANAAAAPAGIAMGRNNQTAGSYFDLMFKPVAGVGVESLTQTQVNTICGSVDRSTPGLFGNVYLSFANGAYAWMQNATMFDGSFFDQGLFLDMLASQIQINGVNLLTSVPALPITDSGVRQMAGVIQQACVQSQTIGFIAPSGTWNGATIGPISAGTSLPQGFYVYAPPVSTLSAGARAARQLPPISVLLIEAQSGHSLQVQVTVQQ